MPEIPSQPQPTSNQKSINWKRILIVAVIGAAVIGLGVLVFLILQPKEETTPTTDSKTATTSAKKDETADWKTAKNDILGFTIKYPPSWGVLMCGNGTTLVADNEFDPESTNYRTEDSKVLAGAMYCGSGARTRIIIYRGEVFTDNVAIWGKFGADKYTNYIQEEITVDGEEGVKSSYISKQSPGMNAGNEFIEYIFNGTGDEALIINYYRAPPDDLNPRQADFSGILEKMVSTLKFLD